MSPRLLAALLAAWPVLGWAAPEAGREDPSAVVASVRQAAQALAPAGATLSLGPVNGAQSMQACPGALAVEMSGSAPYEQAAAHCPALGWTLYVTVTVTQREAVVVAARPIAPGQPLTADDLTLATLPSQQFAGRQVYFDPSQLIGATPDMAIAAGMPLTADSVQAPVMVKAGQTVTVNVQSGGVLLTLDATAEQTGRIGDTILLSNPSTGRRFTAQVTADGVELLLQ
ncbi:MAG TPA: flagellar basal body P-ring formation chaperone FlgA [Acidocella sp.]|jgi:flagella basal body P-ring formation protein FlgA|nr:flagellar basal body P-ring formation chaperone FlgA [Acidocella sp.]